MPRVGSETNSRRGLTAKALARQTFCWLPPESSLAFWLGLWHLMSSRRTYSSVRLFMPRSSRTLSRPPEERAQVLPVDLHGGEGDVPVQALVQQQAHAAAVLGDEGHAHAQHGARGVQGHLPAVEADRSAGGEQAHDPVGNAQLALAGQAADAEDLALAAR